MDMHDPLPFNGAHHATEPVPMPISAPARTPASLVYAAAFIHGLTLVSFPASSGVLKDTLGLDDAQYGSIFLPQVLLALVGALGGGALANRFGLRALLAVSLLALAGSQLALVGTLWAPAGASYPLVLLGTALLGFGFGLGGAPLNGFAAGLFPARRNTALVALHSLLGLGLAVGPLLVGALPGPAWASYPLGLAVAALAMAALSITPILPELAQGAGAGGSRRSPLHSGLFWLFASTAVLYAFAEGVFANWAVVYVAEVRELPIGVAGLALSAFWAALVAGRLLVSALVLRVPATVPWALLPLLMVAAFLLLPGVSGAASAVGFFALAGLACSAFFPLTIALVSERFPDDVARVSSLLIAALMLGVGVGSFLIGGLRSMLPMEDLYRSAIAFPIAALAIGALALRRGRA